MLLFSELLAICYMCDGQAVELQHAGIGAKPYG